MMMYINMARINMHLRVNNKCQVCGEIGNNICLFYKN